MALNNQLLPLQSYTNYLRRSHSAGTMYSQQLVVGLPQYQSLLTHVSQDGKTRFDRHIGAKCPLPNRSMIQFMRGCWYRCSGLALGGDRSWRRGYRDQKDEEDGEGEEETHCGYSVVGGGNGIAGMSGM